MLLQALIRVAVLISCLLECKTFRLVPSIRRTVRCASFSRVDDLKSGQDVRSQRNRLAADLLDAARQVGQVGKWASAENRRRLDELADRLGPFSDPQPARVPLHGTHDLVYSGSDSGPTAGLVGPFVGQVTQFFWNETVYQNRVKWGPLQVSIFGERTIADDEHIRVRFYEAQVHLWGEQVVQRQVDVGPPGTWEHIFVGQVDVGNQKLLLRVLNTPKLFILTQPII